MKNLKPFFTYYGGKYRIAPRYPRPELNRIIEPFAGAAGYSLRHFKKEVILYDVNPKIVSTWDYVINCSERDIKKLPDKIAGDIRELKLSDNAKNIIGFWLNKGSTAPRNMPSRWMRDGTRPNSFWGPAIKKRIITQKPFIKHWKVFQESYKNIPYEIATWFIDPPYFGKAGRLYTYNEIDYAHLAEWVQSRWGQIIVCEGPEARWLDFKPFHLAEGLRGSRGKKYSFEYLYYKDSGF